MSELNNVISRIFENVKINDYIINVIYSPVEVISDYKFDKGIVNYIYNEEYETDVNYLITFYVGNIIGMSFTDDTRYAFNNNFDCLEVECHKVIGDDIDEDFEFFSFYKSSHWYDVEYFIDFINNDNYIVDVNFLLDDEIKFTLEIRRE